MASSDEGFGFSVLGAFLFFSGTADIPVPDDEDGGSGCHVFLDSASRETRKPGRFPPRNREGTRENDYFSEAGFPPATSLRGRLRIVRRRFS